MNVDGTRAIVESAMGTASVGAVVMVSAGAVKSVIGGPLATRGVKAGDKSVAFGMAWMLAGVMGFFWRLLRLKGEPPITRGMLGLIGKPFTLNIQKAERELGYVPHVTRKQGIAEMQRNA